MTSPCVCCLLSQSERKNSCAIAELAGYARPDGLQRLLDLYFCAIFATAAVLAEYCVLFLDSPLALY
jgi:hypothetical protein